MSQVPQDLLRKRELRKIMLAYFDEPQRALNIHEREEFKGYSNEEVRVMMYSLDTTGFIYKLRGTGPGAVYQTADDGIVLMETLLNYKLDDD
jgi:hypothetical protein